MKLKIQYYFTSYVTYCILVGTFSIALLDINPLVPDKAATGKPGTGMGMSCFPGTKPSSHSRKDNSS